MHNIEIKHAIYTALIYLIFMYENTTGQNKYNRDTIPNDIKKKRR